MKVTEFDYKSADNIHDISAYACIPDGEVKAVLQVIHGVAEHFWRYGELCEFLTRRGILVFGNDHLGHGKTGEKGKFGFFAETNGWEYVCRDTVKLSETVKAKYPGKKLIAFGHSMGSFILRTLFMQNRLDAEGYILSGTGHTPGIVIKGGRFISRRIYKKLDSKYDSSDTVTRLAFGSYSKAFKNPRTGFDWISGDEREVDRYINDRYCGFPLSVSLFLDMLDGLDIIRKRKNYNSSHIGKKVLLISGKSDPVGNMGKGVKKVYKAMNKAGIDTEMKLYEGRHELLHENVRNKVMEDIYGFILNS